MAASFIHRQLCVLALAVAGLGACAEALAQDGAGASENVRYDYAQVLSVNPVYDVQRTSSVKRACDNRDLPHGTALTRMMSSVRDRLAAGQVGCKMVTVENESKHLVAYDVDYIYRGSKFRTRMDRDPGSRLRIRISITPTPFD